MDRTLIGRLSGRVPVREVYAAGRHLSIEWSSDGNVVKEGFICSVYSGTNRPLFSREMIYTKVQSNPCVIESPKY